jgi:hypothetical protein
MDANPIEIDFPHHRVKLLLAGEARRVERGMIAVPIMHRADGSLHAMVTTDGGRAIDATIDLASATGGTIPVPAGTHDLRAGAATLHDVDVASGDTPVIGLLAFRHERVIFDLGHDRIWIGG